MHDHLSLKAFHQGEAWNLIEQFLTVRKHIRYLNGHVDQISVLNQNKATQVIRHLNSSPIMEFNYDYAQLKVYVQEYEKNMSGI